MAFTSKRPFADTIGLGINPSTPTRTNGQKKKMGGQVLHCHIKIPILIDELFTLTNLSGVL